ncbi:MogA/MoaB family molybdenum cofactor biosynthesis protein [Desulfosudis oleivorans]|uniref:Molybdenum cofactor biosynthesis protein B n=1 Tax=Desulfosudis oleivorans (strain DSM 6200 / JCM 39069 / Hxd3) TaxID=96561 RepID=A9A080_DESOH|nr:molybdenum cofactor biosynthesis protein B [Desulfosudis oleivorans]ABW68999.1 molybdenum cofactor synthesis domain [Desulfosudis oleivorans Hxd3]
MGTHDHKKAAPRRLDIGILTVSTTRSLADDKSGHWMAGRAKKEGHTVVFHDVVTDSVPAIQKVLCDAINTHRPQIMILTGGTGITPRDVTIEAVRPLFKKELTAFGPVVAQLSLEDIDSAAILSRSVAGIAAKTVVFCIPGSLAACKLICKAVIFPEAGHLAKHVSE